MIIEQYLQCDNCTARTSKLKSKRDRELETSRAVIDEAIVKGWLVGGINRNVDLCPKCREVSK